MNYGEYKQLVKSDRNRYNTNISHLKLFLMNPCYRITVRYRKCKFYEEKKMARLLWFFERYIYNRTCIKYGCDIPSHVEIGSGFRMDHPQGVVINSKAKIGNNFTVKSGAVIGKNEKGVPVIGNNVLLGVHALVIGNITIGDNADIGAGAIVTHDVPENAVVVCEAAKVKRIK